MPGIYKRKRIGAYGLQTKYRRTAGGFKRPYRRSINRTVSRIVKANAEKKGMDTSITTTPIATTNTNGGSDVLNLIQAGTGSWNRVGRKVHLSSARLYGILKGRYGPDTTFGNYLGNTVRMVVVWDKQPSGAAVPTFDTIFGHTLQDGTEGTDFLDPVRYDNMDRFTVVRDKRWDISAHSTPPSTDNAEWIINFDEYIPLNNRETVFSGQSNPMTISDISTGALYVYWRADLFETLPNALVSTDSYCRLRYTDV